MKTLPQSTAAAICQPANCPETRTIIQAMNAESKYHQKAKKPRLMISPEQLLTISINMLNNYSQLFVELS